MLNICIVRICELLSENPVVLQKENDKIMIYFDKERLHKNTIFCSD